jgi:hypothetical protein
MPDGAGARYVGGGVAFAGIGARDRERDPRTVAGAGREPETDVIAGSPGRRCHVEREQAVQLRVARRLTCND